MRSARRSSAAGIDSNDDDEADDDDEPLQYAIDFGSAAAQAVGSVNASHLVCARDLGEMCGWP